MPGIAFCRVNGPIHRTSIGIGGSPFGHKEWKPIGYGGICLALKNASMGSGIEVQGISHIAPTRNFVVRSQVHILAPIRGSYNHKTIWIMATNRINDFGGIGFNISPLDIERFIKDLIDHIGLVPVSSSH